MINLFFRNGLRRHVWCLGKMSGEPIVRNTRLLIEAISATWIDSKEGWIIPPPNALLYAVLPEGVETHNPSPRNVSKCSPRICTSNTTEPSSVLMVVSFNARERNDFSSSEKRIVTSSNGYSTT